MEWSKIIQRLFQLAEPYLAARGDKPHVEVAHAYALSLMEHEGGNNQITEPAIILHDVGWSCLEPKQLAAAYGMGLEGKSSNKLNRIHEKEGAAIARQILELTGFNTPLIDKIIQIIERHDSGRDAHSIEEKIVKDADKLWRYCGAILRSASGMRLKDRHWIQMSIMITLPHAAKHIFSPAPPQTWRKRNLRGASKKPERSTIR
jgi:hypothetical protein